MSYIFGSLMFTRGLIALAWGAEALVSGASKRALFWGWRLWNPHTRNHGVGLYDVIESDGYSGGQGYRQQYIRCLVHPRDRGIGYSLSTNVRVFVKKYP